MVTIPAGLILWRGCGMRLINGALRLTLALSKGEGAFEVFFGEDLGEVKISFLFNRIMCNFTPYIELCHYRK